MYDNGRSMALAFKVNKDAICILSLNGFKRRLHLLATILLAVRVTFDEIFMFFFEF
jgi:hypothetical protein